MPVAIKLTRRLTTDDFGVNLVIRQSSPRVRLNGRASTSASSLKVVHYQPPRRNRRDEA